MWDESFQAENERKYNQGKWNEPLLATALWLRMADLFGRSQFAEVRNSHFCVGRTSVSLFHTSDRDSDGPLMDLIDERRCAV